MVVVIIEDVGLFDANGPNSRSVGQRTGTKGGTKCRKERRRGCAHCGKEPDLAEESCGKWRWWKSWFLLVKLDELLPLTADSDVSPTFCDARC